MSRRLAAKTNEEKLDRRAHWVQLLVTGLIGATVFCVTIKLAVTQLEQDFKDYRKEMKVILKDLDNRVDDVSDKTNANAKDIEWLKSQRR